MYNDMSDREGEPRDDCETCLGRQVIEITEANYAAVLEQLPPAAFPTLVYEIGAEVPCPDCGEEA